MAQRFPAYPWILLLFGSLLLTACTNSGVDTGGLQPVPPASMFVEHNAPFCGNQAPDKFTAGYFGSSPLDTTVYFYIVCHQGDTVYRDQWPGEWMAPENVANDSLKIAHVHQSLRQLVEGRLSASRDSLDAQPAGDQPIFGYAIGTQRSAFIYYSATDHQVHQL